LTSALNTSTMVSQKPVLTFYRYNELVFFFFHFARYSHEFKKIKARSFFCELRILSLYIYHSSLEWKAKLRGALDPAPRPGKETSGQGDIKEKHHDAESHRAKEDDSEQHDARNS
jgi:hypothetical protein